MNCQATTLDAYNLLHKGALALAQVERNGMCIDVGYCHMMSTHLDRQIAKLNKDFQESELVKLWKSTYRSKTNLNSGQQLADILYNRMKLEPIKYTKNGNPSTDEEALEALNVPGIQAYLHISGLEKVRDTYLKGFLREQVDGIVHCFFNLNIAKSFRPSTEAPNLANVPKRDPEAQKICRQAIKARPGHLILSADFKGVEVSMGCCYHNDPNMITYVSDASKDMHRDMGMKLFFLILEEIKGCKPCRQTAKNSFVFPQFYGDWWKSCAGYMWINAHLETHRLASGVLLIDHLKQHGIKSLEDFEKHVEKIERWMWDEKWAVYTEWKKQFIADYQKNGYFDMLTGFRCSGVMDRKQVCNYPIQGSAFHAMLQCIIWMQEDAIKEGWKSHVCNQIYDDMMVDAHPDELEMVIDRMQYYMTEKIRKHWKWINVPFEIDISTTPVDGTWYELKELKK